MPTIMVAPLRPDIPKHINIIFNNPRPNLSRDRTFPYKMISRFHIFPAENTQQIRMDTIFCKVIFDRKNVIDNSPTTDLSLKRGF